MSDDRNPGRPTAGANATQKRSENRRPEPRAIPNLTATTSDLITDKTQPLRLGTWVDRYNLVSKLGGGGSSVVYKAYDAELDRTVALKVLQPNARGDSKLARRRLLRDARALAKTSHANVVPVYDVGETRGYIFIAMELIDGSDLAAWLSETKRSWTQVAEVFLQAGEGLAAAHAAGLHHRDIRPANILVGNDGRVRMLDFGVARIAAGNLATLEKPAALPDTALGAQMIGMPAYVAPEQCEGAQASELTDQYGLCVAMWEALYGAPPFHAPDRDQLVAQILAGNPQPPTNHNIPPRLRQILSRGLARNPSDRYPRMRDLLDDLGQLCNRARRIRLGLTLGGVVLLALLLAGIASAT